LTLGVEEYSNNLVLFLVYISMHPRPWIVGVLLIIVVKGGIIVAILFVGVIIVLVWIAIILIVGLKFIFRVVSGGVVFS
jgi:hypothetical protein